MKRFVLSIICALAVGMPAFAADVAARMTCEDVTLEISKLVAIVNPTDDDTARLDTLRAQQRKSCTKSAGARRTNGARIASAAPAKPAEDTAVIAETATENMNTVDSFLAKKQENCKALADSIEKLKSAAARDEDTIAKMQAQYDADCAERVAQADAPQTPQAADTTTDTTPEIDEAAAAQAEAERINAFLDAGLCADGTKPNKYGCCPGEKFTDLGNLVFACCPDDDGMCFPPINNGGAL